MPSASASLKVAYLVFREHEPDGSKSAGCRELWPSVTMCGQSRWNIFSLKRRSQPALESFHWPRRFIARSKTGLPVRAPGCADPPISTVI